SAKNDGNDLTLPAGYRFINVKIANSAWSKFTHLPTSPQTGDVVRIHRTSHWDTFVLFPSHSMLVPNNSEIEFVYNGREWVTSTDSYQVAVSHNGTDIILPNNKKNIIVNLKNGAWTRTVYLPQNPISGDIVKINRQSQWEVHVTGKNISQSITPGTTTYTFDGNQWHSSKGSEYEIFPIVSSLPISIPNNQKNMIIRLRDGAWQKKIELPDTAPLGSILTIQHQSTYRSYINNINDNSIEVPYHAVSKYLFDGKQWNHISTEENNITHIINSSIHDINLNNITPEKIATINVDIQNPIPLKKQPILDLNAISITDGTLLNQTPYDIAGIYIQKNSDVFYIHFKQSVPPYSSVQVIDPILNGAEIINTSKIANNRYDFHAPLQSQNRPEARYANEQERNSVERVQMYERFWINAPETLAEITQQIDSQCYTNAGYSECANYHQPKLDYTGDMYFAQSVSNLTSQFWVDPTVWGLANTSIKELTASHTQNRKNLWMSPRLMANMLSGDAGTAIDAEQGLIHEYYHNLGFSHNSGWASNQGIDDLFGKKAYHIYRSKLKNNYRTSNIVIHADKIDSRTFMLNLKAIGEISNLKLRLLSTSDLDAHIEQQNNKIYIKFNTLPQSDVYASIYSKESDQMSTVILNGFVGSVSGQTALNQLTHNFSDLIQQYDQLFIHTANGSWVRNFYLPEHVAENKVVIFSSNASYYSVIHYNGNRTTIKQGQKIKFIYNSGLWNITEN
ncbi:hypothetical protein ACPV5G_16040, partial [Photobacterium damselae]|uniref:hypothetical protein n=1 Tax=Photobacterium damselae TaxID=38293 RepID=UPI0040683B01